MTSEAPSPCNRMEVSQDNTSIWIIRLVYVADLLMLQYKSNALSKPVCVKTSESN